MKQYVAIVLCLVALSCSSSPGEVAGRASPPPLPPYFTPSPTPAQQRTPTPRLRLKIRNEAIGPSRGRLIQAMRDLRAVGVWRRLTRGLYTLQLQTDPAAIPDDAHLADARTDPVIDDDGAGTQCSIRFYPEAIKRELATLEEGHARGVLGPPPTLRRLWALVLVHELAHCLRWNAGEPFASGWEERVRQRLDALNLE